MTTLALLSPATGRPLRAESPHALTDGTDRWPVVDGIPYLRAGRDDLRREALAALDAGDERAALVALLRDQDPFAPVGPPRPEFVARLLAEIDAGRATLRSAMTAMNFGPVGNYFAVRTSTPTFLSGLGLLSQCGGDLPVVEVACGIGQLLREVCRRGGPAAGIDLVFGKLWLARRFVVPRAELVCGDACGGPVAEPTAAAAVLCHDAFYFFADKPRAAAALQALAGTGGRVLIGHAHNRDYDHGGVAGHLLTPEGYAELFPGCLAFGDAAFAAAHLSGAPAEPDPPAALGAVEAVSLAWRRGDTVHSRAPDGYADPVEGTELVLNPLLRERAGRLSPDWPSPAFAAEYRSADYLAGEPVPVAEVLHAAASGLFGTTREHELTTPDVWSEVRRLARKRVLIPAEDVV